MPTNLGACKELTGCTVAVANEDVISSGGAGCLQLNPWRTRITSFFTSGLIQRNSSEMLKINLSSGLGSLFRYSSTYAPSTTPPMVILAWHSNSGVWITGAGRGMADSTGVTVDCDAVRLLQVI